MVALPSMLLFRTGAVLHLIGYVCLDARLWQETSLLSGDGAPFCTARNGSSTGPRTSISVHQRGCVVCIDVNAPQPDFSIGQVANATVTGTVTVVARNRQIIRRQQGLVISKVVIPWYDKQPYGTLGSFGSWSATRLPESVSLPALSVAVAENV